MGRRTRDAEAELNLPPGFRFHPTDEELVVHYLCRKAASQRLSVPIIAEVDLYRYDPWELPEKALFGQKEWYFFTPRDRKYPNGSRPNRAAGRGYWKATGADKPIAPRGSGRPLGIKKALVFYNGKAPKGVKTEWIMHEYRLAGADRSPGKKGSLRLDDWVLCRLYNKKGAWGTMQQCKKEEESSFGETMDSVGTNDEANSESCFRTPESDVEHDAFAEPDGVGQLGVANPAAYPFPGDGEPPQGIRVVNSSSGGLQMADRLKEENEWFMDVNFEDLQRCLESMPAIDPPNQDYHHHYYSGFASPFLNPGQVGNNMNMPPPY